MPFALWALGNSEATYPDIERALDLPHHYFRELKKRRPDLRAMVDAARSRRSDYRDLEPGTKRLGDLIPSDWVV